MAAVPGARQTREELLLMGNKNKAIFGPQGQNGDFLRNSMEKEGFRTGGGPGAGRVIINKE